MKNIKHNIAKVLNDSHFSELLKGASTTFLLKIIGLIVGYVLAVFITNRYGAYVFGQYVTALLVVEILAIFSRLGIDTSLVRFISKYIHQGTTRSISKLYYQSVTIVTLMAMLLSILLWFFSNHIAQFMNLDRDLLILVSYSFIPLVLFHMNVQSIRGLKNMTSFSFFNNVSIPLGTFVVLAFCSYFLTNETLPIYAYVLSVLSMTFFSFVVWFRFKANLPKQESNPTNFLSTNELLAISFPLLLGQSMMIIMGKVDLFMLANMTSSEQVGVYNIALKLSMLSYMGLMAVNSIAAPKFSEIHSSGDIDALKRIVQQSTKTIFWVSAPVLLVLIFFPSSILSMFGDEFKLAAMCLIILSIGKMFSAISGSVGTFLQMVGRQKIFQNILIVAALINVGLNSLLIPNYGIEGAAIASTVSGVFWNLLMIFYIKKHFGFYTIYLPWLKR